MPQLVCPNDSAAMQSVTRSGVGFDFCPTCRGVWLDRGELDKLMEASQGGEAEVGPVPPQPSERPWRGQEPRLDSRYRRYQDRDHDYDHGEDSHRRRKRGFDLFDIFD